MSNFLNNASRSYNIIEQGENFIVAKLTFTFNTPISYKQYKLNISNDYMIMGDFNVNDLTDNVAKSLTYFRINGNEYIINGEIIKITFSVEVLGGEDYIEDAFDAVTLVDNDYQYQNNAVNANTNLNDKYIYIFTYGTLCSGLEMVNVLRNKDFIKVDNYDIKKQPIFIRRMIIPNYD